MAAGRAAERSRSAFGQPEQELPSELKCVLDAPSGAALVDEGRPWVARPICRRRASNSLRVALSCSMAHLSRGFRGRSRSPACHPLHAAFRLLRRRRKVTLLVAHELEQLVEGGDELFDPLTLERCDDVVVVDARCVELVEEVLRLVEF